MEMKKILLIIPVLLLAFAAGKLLAQESGLIPVKIYINSHQDVYKFPALGVAIEELRDGYVEARISPAKMAELGKMAIEGAVTIGVLGFLGSAMRPRGP